MLFSAGEGIRRFSRFRGKSCDSERGPNPRADFVRGKPEVFRPERGVVFDGRVAEDFKLGSGTWVSVGTLRVRVVSALAPHAQDVVVTGHDRDEVGVLVFPTPQAAALPAHELRAHVAAALQRLKAEGGGSSQAPARALLLSEPPSVDAGEITDKGYINQRAVLKRRDAQVQALHAGGPDVILAR